MKIIFNTWNLPLRTAFINTYVLEIYNVLIVIFFDIYLKFVFFIDQESVLQLQRGFGIFA